LAKLCWWRSTPDRRAAGNPLIPFAFMSFIAATFCNLACLRLLKAEN
jgi:hypothetical protein